jgi:hypothetical protein
MPGISGSIRFFEAGKQVRKDIDRRLYGLHPFFWWVVAILWLAFMLAFLWQWDQIDWYDLWNRIPWVEPWSGRRLIDKIAHGVFRLLVNGPWIVTMIGFLILSQIAGLHTRLRRRHYRKTYADRGGTLSGTISLTPTTEGLVYDDEGSISTLRWSSLSDVFSSEAYWILMVPVSAIVLPKRFFVDESAERAFIREILDHMTVSARTRIREALKFAAAK